MSKQQQVAKLYEQHSYTTDIQVLALGLCEEAGEVAAAVLDRTATFKPKPGRAASDLKRELNDCLVYLCAIANVTGIDLGI